MRMPSPRVALTIAVLVGQVAGAPSKADAETSIRLAPVVSTGLEAPLFVTHAGDDSGRLFILERPGRIRIWVPGGLSERPFLDLAANGRVLAGGERGLLDLAFR
jgi:hypothetical protein